MKSTKYQKDWRRYVFYQKTFLYMIPLMIVGYGLLMLEFSFIPQEWIAYYLMVVWGIFGLAGLCLFYFHCPLCGEYFFAGKLRINLMQSHCVNCEAEKYSGSTYKRFRIGKRFGF